MSKSRTVPVILGRSGVDGVRILLRLEGLLVLATSCIIYNYLHPAWGKFFLLFLLPDISFFAYIVGKKFGAFFYNLTHTYISPIILLLIAYFNNFDELVPYVIIWFAHIGFDRTLGCGLKYFTGFSDTSLSPSSR